MVSRLCAACDAGNASANECAYGDVADITHSDRDTRAHIHRNADASADRNRCAAHNDAERDVHDDV